MSGSDRRHARARETLEGLAVGDALGEQFFGRPELVEARELPAPVWRWTDDTLMACSVVEVLERRGSIDEELLFASFAERYDPTRGYGTAAERLLAGAAEHRAAATLFDGAGSYGNGAAMRVAPLGAWFADDPERAAAEADRSALATHTHAEGRAGAVAVAVAAARAAALREEGAEPPEPGAFLEEIAAHVPTGRTRTGLERAAELPAETSPGAAASELGSGHESAAFDTVPFALWSAARSLADFEEALWATAAGRGDSDTTCAIACGVVTSYAGIEGIPSAWREAREPLPAWLDG